MDGPQTESAMTWEAIRKHSVKIAIGIVSLVAISTAVIVLMPYQRELRIAKKIESRGGYAVFDFHGPDWFPDAIKYKLPFWNRIDFVILENQAFPFDLLSDLEMLTTPYELALNNVELTDQGLEFLKRLTRLKGVSLRRNQITDAGLEHFKGLTKLERLDFSDTETSVEGRDMLRKALPNCLIDPAP